MVEIHRITGGWRVVNRRRKQFLGDWRWRGGLALVTRVKRDLFFIFFLIEDLRTALIFFLLQLLIEETEEAIASLCKFQGLGRPQTRS